MSTLFKESLADAKAVRATALANAKIALEEAFGERIQAMFAERLKNEAADENSDEVIPSGTDNNEVPVGQTPTEDDGGQTGDAEGDDISNADLEEIIAELEKDAQTVDQTPVDPAAPVAPAAVDPTTPVAPAAPVDPTAPVAPAAPVVPTAPEQLPGDEEEINLEELLAELEGNEEEGNEEEGNGESGEEKCDECGEQQAVWETQLKEVRSERDEAIKTVEILRSQINEVNLLNAKLLYTNKLFKQFGLNNEQKMKVVENFDLTTNVREVKLTYAIMAESFNLGGSVVKKKNTTATTITEGLASKAVASTKPTQEIVSSANDMAERFKTLAGIKTNSLKKTN